MELTLHTEFPDHLADEWNELLNQSAVHVPFLRHEYLKVWWQTRGGGEWPKAELALITAHQGGHLLGVAPLFLADPLNNPSLFNLGSIEISDYLDLITPPERLPEFTEALFTFLGQHPCPEWKTLEFYNFIDTSPTLPFLEKAANGAGWKYKIEKLQQAPYIVLPGDWETYLAGIDKKQRHEIRRKMRRAEEAEVPVRWYIAADPDVLEEEIESFLGLMAHDPDKAAFLTPGMREHMRLTIRCAFESDCLQLAFIEIGGKKAAAYLSFLYLDRLWIYNSGLDRAFQEYSPGWVLLGHLLKWANENKVSEFDFMRGDEDYKYRFGAVDRAIVHASISR